MTTKHQTFCRICEQLCGLEVEVENNTITDIRPDKQHVATAGYGCAKGFRQHKMYDSPDRLQYPLMRINGQYQRVSWEEALADIGEKVKRIRREFSDDSLALYVGTAAGFAFMHPIFAQAFISGLNSTNIYTSATQDCASKFAVATQMYGFPFTQPLVDIERTQCLIIVGANPAVSKWSFGQVSNPMKALAGIEDRGGRIYVVDPRKTETAKRVGQHVPIRPNSDVFFYLSFLDELIKQNGVVQSRVEQHMKGLDTLKDFAARWPAEKTARVTGIPAEVLREMVNTYRTADSAALYCSTGVNMGGNGALAFWIQETINAVSGNLDRTGGTVLGQGVIQFEQIGEKYGLFKQPHRSRIGDFTAVNDAFPGAILADEILTPGERQIRGLFVTGGNPLITMPNANRLREAFKELELLVVVDIYQNETASMATHILPATSPLERPDLPFSFPLFMGMQSKPYIQATDRIVKATGEQRDEATIYVDLARACGAPLWGSRVAQIVFQLAKAWNSLWTRDEQPSIPQKALLSLILRLVKEDSFNKLLTQHPHGRARPDHEGDRLLGKRITTPDGLVNLAPEAFIKHAEKLDADFEEQLTHRDQLRLITRRAVTSQNSWTHNIEEFVRGDNDTNYLYMNPSDAQNLGFQEGALLDVQSKTSTVRVPMKLLPELSQGVVALPHGWGHQVAKGLSVANQTSGVNSNILAADGIENIERISGMAHLTGIPVEVKPAAAPLVKQSWSGLSEDVVTQ